MQTVQLLSYINAGTWAIDRHWLHSAAALLCGKTRYHYTDNNGENQKNRCQCK